MGVHQTLKAIMGVHQALKAIMGVHQALIMTCVSSRCWELQPSSRLCRRSLLSVRPWGRSLVSGKCWTQPWVCRWYWGSYASSTLRCLQKSGAARKECKGGKFLKVLVISITKVWIFNTLYLNSSLLCCTGISSWPWQSFWPSLEVWVIVFPYWTLYG